LAKGTLQTSREVVSRLISEGWVLTSVRGSHHKFSKDGRTVIVPHPRKHLPVGTARAIAKTAGWV
jgi:predicted RNA binding protein YcfA (HicA-like mRNA interferase family)